MAFAQGIRKVDQFPSYCQKFYQLFSYKVDVDLEEKLPEWGRFHNFRRLYGAHNGKTPHEAHREKQ